MGGLLTSENREICISILVHFSIFLKQGAKIVFSDEDGAWTSAISHVIDNVPAYAGCVHILCAWHMSNHIWGHAKKHLV
jgi:hypothetical protein